jgi:hypothetical protein
LIETCINLCYIVAAGPDTALTALRHARQKAYLDLERESKIGDSIIRLIYQGRPDLEELGELAADIEEFTSRTGREKAWTDLSVDDRIAPVGEELGASVLNKLHMARFAVYRHASEIIHRSVFGTMYFLGATVPSRHTSSPEHIEKYVGQQQIMILLVCVLALAAVLEAYHVAYGFSRIDQESRELLEKLRDLSIRGRGDGGESNGETTQ